MPANPSWLLHLPEIIDQLEVFKVPVVDRAIVQMVFGLGRRQAIEFLHRFGGYQAGKTFLIDRLLLIDGLRRLMAGENFQNEIRRKERLDQTISQLRRSRAGAHVRIPVRPEVVQGKVARLSAGIALEAGHLHIEFSGTEDLLTKLYEIAKAAANDFDQFRAAAEAAQ